VSPFPRPSSQESSEHPPSAAQRLHKPLGSLALIGTASACDGADTPRPDKAGPPTPDTDHNPEPEPKPPPSDDRPAAVAEEAPEGEEAPADEMEA